MSEPAVSPPARPPTPLLVAVALAVVEGLALIGYGVAELFALEAARVTMGVSTALFFFVYGAGLVFCAWSARRLNSWARAPLVLAQLIQLGVAWSFRGGAATVTAAVLALVAAVVLAGIFHPASIRALTDDPV